MSVRVLFGYLNDLSRQLYLEPPKEREILDELKGHIEDSATELIEAGTPSHEAHTLALHQLGASKSLARKLYEVHAQSTWPHTVLAVLPHLLLALMFGLQLWTTPGWIILMLVVATVISIFGWSKGRPTWTYPWLGYCLVAPLVSWGLAMSAVVYGAWSILTRGTLPLSMPIYLVCFAYIAFSLWVVIRIVTRVVRRDWLMASLAVLPFPFLVYWFIYFYDRTDLKSMNLGLHDVDNIAAIVFLILAAATAIFFRIGRRLVRVALLAITAPSMVVLAWLSYQGGRGYMAMFVFLALSLLLLLAPALLDRKINRSSEPTILPSESD